MLQGDALKVALAPCRESRQVERMTKWKRKVDRRWQIWAGDEVGDKLTLKKKKKAGAPKGQDDSSFKSFQLEEKKKP